VDLILWRHAEAEELVPGESDLERALTRRGRRQARDVARWLQPLLSHRARIWVSPAKRARQTADALPRSVRVCDELVPEARVDGVLRLLTAHGSSAAHRDPALLLVGHQPWLGQVASRVLDVPELACDIRKGAVWWMHPRERDGRHGMVLSAVFGPGMVRALAR
jgi:phosphohistidine phosphatase